MAIRNIILEDDPRLRQKSRKVEVIDEKIIELLDDMRDTLIKADGVGLAAPQVGILKRVVVINTGDQILDLINPEIIGASGEQRGIEGCLSIPSVFGTTIRPKRVLAIAQDRTGAEYHITGEDLLARCICHEIDHLNGVLFREHVIKYSNEG